MRGALVLLLCVFLTGCAAAPVAEKKTVEEKKVSRPAYDVTSVAATRSGVLTKLRGKAYLQVEGSDEFTSLQEGDPIPAGRAFYLAPRTTTRIKQDPGEDIYLYSQEQRVYYRLEITKP